ncbi:MAG: amino acid adenylation domain-containing protein [Pseudomonadota bacterium]
MFLSKLANVGIRISTVGGNLKCYGPQDILSGELGRTIKARKQEILTFLNTGNSKNTLITTRSEADAPLSAAQTRLWVEETLNQATTHSIPFAIRALGELDVLALDVAFRHLLQRHSVLRMRISLVNGRPIQRVAEEFLAPLVAEPSARLSEEGLQGLTNAEASRRFDLTREGPIRLRLLRRSPTDHVILLTIHHIAVDGTSIEILLRDLAAFYSEEAAGFRTILPELPIQYGDYAAWQASEIEVARQDRQIEFWEKHLGESPPITALRTDHPRPSLQSRSGARCPIRISAGLTDRLREIATNEGASLFALLFAAFNALISRYTGQDELVVGTPSANRGHPEVEALIGLFVNPLPIRTCIRPGLAFDDLLRQTQQNLLDAQDHQDVPFERIVDRIQPFRDASASPLFRLKFQLDRAPKERIDLPGLVLRRLPQDFATAHHDLSLDLVETEDVAGVVTYAAALFDSETVAQIVRHFVQLLEAIAEAPKEQVGELDYLSKAETADLLFNWNCSDRQIDPNLRFAQLFETRAEAQPDAIAVQHVEVGAEVSETYAQLNGRANRLAHALRANGVGPNSVVAIAMDRGPDQVAAWLGVLKSGAAYLPLDPTYPQERLDYMLHDSGAALLLAEAKMSIQESVVRWDIDQSWPDGSDLNPTGFTDPTDLAYVIYTSGSTGIPKGVEVTHEGLANLALDKIRVCQVDENSRVFGFFSFSFDASIPDLVMSLGAGATLLTASAEDVLPGPRMARLLQEWSATHLTITPSALAHLPAVEYRDLRMVLVGGEPPSEEIINRWSSGRTFVNAYGPTETTVNASMTYHKAGHPEEPYLRPSANKKLHVLDANLNLLPVGCEGELCIGGTGLAKGYRNLPEKTASAFVKDPYGSPSDRLYRSGDRAVRHRDGRIQVLGRLDDQVKIRGYLIEPNEVSQTLRTLSGVADAVVAPKRLNGDLRLVAYLVAQDHTASRDAPMNEVREKLPRHLIPDATVWLESLPLTANGKLDARALPIPDLSKRAGRPLEGEVETQIAAIVGEIVGKSDLTAEDDFFELGGTSLMATRLIVAIEDRFGQQLRAGDLFQASSVAAIAKRISEGATAQEKSEAPWRDDLVLPAEIAFSGAADQRSGIPECVLLTGATGFVGSHLLRELLRDPDRTVVCLVRKDPGSIETALRRFRLWTAGLSHRIICVRGDLSSRGLGLSDKDAEFVQEHVGAVFHCAAEVHHLKPYKTLRDANVGGTIEILRLSARLGFPLNYIGTLSAITAGNEPLDETAKAQGRAAPRSGYDQSKWVAEQLVDQAEARGLPARIFRLGSIVNDRHSGAFNPSDILSRQLQGYLATGKAPGGVALLNVLPADYLATAICNLAGRPDTLGHTFHMCHSKAISSDLLFDAVSQEGHQITRIETSEWQQLLSEVSRGDSSHPLFSLAAIGTPQGFTGETWPYTCETTRSYLSALPEPEIDLAFLRHSVAAIVADLKERGQFTETTTSGETDREYNDWAWFYDRTLGPAYRDRKMDFLDRVALQKLGSGDRVLDLCCGTGQMMRPLLERGLRVTGLDLSDKMLGFAAVNAPDAKLIKGDARDFDLDEPVDAVICASASLNHMESLFDLGRVFHSVYRNLSRGGVFVFDMNHPDQMKKHWSGAPAAGDIRDSFAWMITPSYETVRREGDFFVDMYRKPETGGSHAGSSISRAFLRRPLLRRRLMARLCRFGKKHPDWAHAGVRFPVYGHAIEDILHLLRDCGFEARVETLSGHGDVDEDQAACFIARKPDENLTKRAVQ